MFLGGGGGGGGPSTSFQGSCSDCGLPSKFSCRSQISHRGNVTLEFGKFADGNNRVVFFFCGRNIYFNAFVKYEAQAWRDGPAVGSFHTDFKLSAHLRDPLLLRLVPRVCKHWTGTQTQDWVSNDFCTV